MIVTIDGPAGAGKSSAARLLAERLGYCFLDTGAMYRVVALAAVRSCVDWHQTRAVAELAGLVSIEFDGPRVLLDGEDVTEAIRTPEVTANTRHVADNPPAREHLVALQRRLAEGKDVVTEGRDQGTVAFPDAQCKIFLTASPHERARRRLLELQGQGETVTLEQVLDQQNQRDERDQTRQVGPLVPATDSTIVITDGLSLEQVVDHLEQIVRQRRSATG